MIKIYAVPIDRLNIDDIRKAFKKAKADARANKAASNLEGGQKDASKPNA